MKQKNAFTLAETLITLVIVGVIAALTVPSLISKYQEQQTVSRLKKVYSTLAQATNHIISEEGPVTSWVTSPTNIYELYRKKLLNAKTCDNKSGCFNQGKYTYLNKKQYSGNWNSDSKRYKLILSDGTQIMFDGANDYNQNCTITNLGSTNFCIGIAVDLNGEKKPNVVGRDLFYFVIKEDGLYPAGCDYDGYCTKTSSGYGCACKVLRENAVNY